MRQVVLYSVVLLAGIILSQSTDLSSYDALLRGLTLVCLSYVMIEVGLEFEIDKEKLPSYAWDYVIAAGAASIPWLLVSGYFFFVLESDWQESFLIGRFAAPTSAGVLLSMLVAAKLSSTWMYKKARVLVIFDDLDTVLFMIPLQIIIMGFQLACFTIIGVITVLLFVAYRWLHRVSLPTAKPWLLAYGLAVFALSEWIEHTDLIHHLEVLVPAFVLGCVLQNTKESEIAEHEKHISSTVRVVFMFLVGSSLPKLSSAPVHLGPLLLHVLFITILCNLGKCLPAFTYRKEASFRERLALSVAMFPRGEVGAGVLVIALGYGFGGLPAAYAGLSLALNLLLTGLFIYIVKLLVSSEHSHSLI